jgi:hypothetical protein
MGLDTKPGADRTKGSMALNQREAARALSVSVDTFARHIAPELRCVHCGRLRLYSVSELERWLERNAERSAAA